MSIVKFKTNYSGDKIEKVEVLRETEAFVYLPQRAVTRTGKDERREAKRGEFAQYHDSWSAAHAHLREKAESAVESARQRLEMANDKLGNINGMKPPKEIAK